MPRILFIVENNTVPPDIRVWREARTARDAGYGVTVIAPRNDAYPARHEVVDGIEIYRHPQLAAGGGKLGQVLEYANALLWETFLSIRLFLNKRFHVIHAANPPDHVFLIALLFRPAGVRYIFDHHDLAAELYVSKFAGRKGLVYRVLSLMERLSCRTAHAVVTTNASYAAYVTERHRIAPEKISIVRNDPEAPMPARSVKPKQQGPRANKLVYVGSINRQDGVDLLVRAVHALARRQDAGVVHCTVIGDGDDLPRVRALCAELSVEARFEFTGYVYDRTRVRAAVEAADICVEPAPLNEANRRSTFIKIMEYMAAGKPIVAFDLPETRFSAGEGSALLVEPGSIECFADAIARLMGDPALRERLGACGRDRIATVLNWQNAAVTLLQVYARVTGTSADRPRLVAMPDRTR